MGTSLVPGGPRNANERGEVVIKSEPMGALPKSRLLSARKNSGKKRSKINVKRVHCGEILVKKKKFTDSEEEDKKRDKNKKLHKKVNKKPEKDSSPEESEDDDSDLEKEDKKECRKKRVSSPRGIRKSLLPERYDGTTPLTIFLTQLESCARYNKWSVKDKAIHLKVSLKRNAAYIIDVETFEDATYKQLVARLKCRFGTEGQSYLYQAGLRVRRHGKKET